MSAWAASASPREGGGWGGWAGFNRNAGGSQGGEGPMVVGGGSKTFSSDRLVGSSESSFGRVVEDPECFFHNMNEEHGYVDIRRAGREFSVGDRVRIIPNHVCVAVNLHEHVYGMRKAKLEPTWKVEGRGKLQ